jgi:putative inorganic carbon (hco3(-)) transporter
MNAVRAPGLSQAAPAGEATLRAEPPNWPFLAFVLLMPLQNVYSVYFPKLGGGLNFLNVMFVASLLGAWLCGGRLVRGPGVNGWTWTYVAMSVFSLLVGLAAVHDGDAHPNILKDQTIAIAFLFLAQMSVRDEAGVRTLLLASLLPLPYIASVVIDQHAAVSSWHYSHDLRVSGTFSELGANEMGAYCTTAMLVALGLLVGVRSDWKWKLLLASAVACAGLGVVLSYSRTAYVAALLGLTLIGVLLLRRGGLRALLGLLVAAALLSPLLPASVVERFDSIELAEGARDESTERRFEFWQLARASFAAHPLVGTGYHTFHHAQVNPNRTDTHNFFLRELAEKGLLGAAVLLGLLYSIARMLAYALRHAAADSWTHGLALGLSGAFVALLCGNGFGDRFTHYAMIAHFWLYLGLLLRGLTLTPPGDEDARL